MTVLRVPLTQPCANDEARTILYHARMYLLRGAYGIAPCTMGDIHAVELMMDIEMGLAYNVSAPGRGI